MFVHQVFFWHIESTNPQDRENMKIDGELLLKKIPGVRHLWVGRPAMTPREVVDNSYDLGLCIIFDDRPALDVYQEHPLHKEFMSRYKHTWKRLQIYDFC